MAHDPGHIPMRELERLTGFPRATILYYIKEGLLPQPQKTARNMAYYDCRFVDGLKLIRQLKEQHNLSLQQIKQVLQKKTGGVGISLLLDVRDRIFRQVATTSDQPPVTWKELLAETGLDEETLQQLAAVNIVFPQPQPEASDREHLYHYDNVVIGRLFKRFIELGIPLEALTPMAESLARVSEIEVGAFFGHVSQPMFLRGESPDEIWTAIQTSVDLAHSLVSLLHLRTLYRFMLCTEWPNHIAEEIQAYLDPPARDS
ncbi:MAG: MerR family transcriptional regulator [Chloroflexi bacterium]|nr:MerR family transcriptional regulator [Chloroflexota bacterium]